MRTKRRLTREQAIAMRQRTRRASRRIREELRHAHPSGEITITGGRGVRMWTAPLGTPAPTGSEPPGPDWVLIAPQVDDNAFPGTAIPGRCLATSISFDILDVIDDRGPIQHDPWQDN